MDLEAMFEIGVNLDEKISKIHDRVTKIARPVRKPVGNSLVQSASAPSPIFLKINDTPSTGRMWFIKKIGIFGTDGHTSVANAIADVYIGPLEEVGGVPITDFSAQVITGGTGNVPSITRYGRKDQPCSSNESIYAILYAVPANQQIVLVAEVDEWWIEDQEAMGL